MQDRIRELEQSRLLIDGELKKSRNGLKPRPQRATTTPAVASPPATREEEAPPPTPVSQRKEVRFDLENIDYREDSRTDLSQDLTQASYYEWYPEPTFANLPMGICYPIVGVPPFQCDESFLSELFLLFSFNQTFIFRKELHLPSETQRGPRVRRFPLQVLQQRRQMDLRPSRGISAPHVPSRREATRPRRRNPRDSGSSKALSVVFPYVFLF